MKNDLTRSEYQITFLITENQVQMPTAPKIMNIVGLWALVEMLQPVNRHASSSKRRNIDYFGFSCALSHKSVIFSKELSKLIDRLLELEQIRIYQSYCKWSPRQNNYGNRKDGTMYAILCPYRTSINCFYISLSATLIQQNRLSKRQLQLQLPTVEIPCQKDHCAQQRHTSIADIFDSYSKSNYTVFPQQTRRRIRIITISERETRLSTLQWWQCEMWVNGKCQSSIYYDKLQQLGSRNADKPSRQ